MDRLLRPYRVLLVSDEAAPGGDPRVIDGDGELAAVAGELRWAGVPFEVLRLPDEPLTTATLLDRDGPAYGLLVWLASAPPCPRAEAAIKTASEELGISLLVLSDHLDHTVFSVMLGIRFRGSYDRRSRYQTTGEHFITSGLEPGLLPGATEQIRVRQPLVTARGAQVVLTCDGHPAATVYEHEGRRAAWLGSGADGHGGGSLLALNPGWRLLLKRTVTWLLGYTFGPDYRSAVQLALEGVGSPEGCFSGIGQYPLPDLNAFERRILRPLREHAGLLTCHLHSAFPDAGARRLVPLWDRHFVDAFGNAQDFGSLRAGLVRGVDMGVLELQAGGYSGCAGDLSDWWDALCDEGKSNHDWYQEWAGLSGQGEPAAVQTRKLARARAAMAADWGASPLSLATGGQALCLVPGPRHTPSLAAAAGYRLLDHQWLLSPDCVQRCLRPAAALHRIPLHDQALDQGLLRRLLLELPEPSRFLRQSEVIAHAHSRVAVAPAGNGLSLRWPDAAGQAFRERESHWLLTLSDQQQRDLAGRSVAWLRVNGEVVEFNARTEEQGVTLPAGDGAEIEFVSAG